MDDPVETLSYKGYKIDIFPDTDSPDPYEIGDEMVRMVVFASDYKLGSNEDFKDPSYLKEHLYQMVYGAYIDDDLGDYASWNQRKRAEDLDGNDLTACRTLMDAAVKHGYIAAYCPLEFYDYGGGQIRLYIGTHRRDEPDGFAYILREDVPKFMGWKNLTKKRRAFLQEQVEDFVEYYNDYLEGNVYGYVITGKDGEETDDGWGFIGDSDQCLEEAKSVVDREVGDRLSDNGHKSLIELQRQMTRLKTISAFVSI
jgi:hypothetical protein